MRGGFATSSTAPVTVRIRDLDPEASRARTAQLHREVQLRRRIIEQAYQLPLRMSLAEPDAELESGADHSPDLSAGDGGTDE